MKSLLLSVMLILTACSSNTEPTKDLVSSPTSMASPSTVIQTPTPEVKILKFNGNVLPLTTCGDPNNGEDTWYPVFVNNEVTQSIARSLYCKDAVTVTRKDSGVKAIQVASFTTKERADEFAQIIGGEVGPGNYFPKHTTLDPNYKFKEVAEHFQTKYDLITSDVPYPDGVTFYSQGSVYGRCSLLLDSSQIEMRVKNESFDLVDPSCKKMFQEIVTTYVPDSASKIIEFSSGTDVRSRWVSQTGCDIRRINDSGCTDDNMDIFVFEGSTPDGDSTTATAFTTDTGFSPISIQFEDVD